MFCLSIGTTQTANILAVLPSPSPSHLIIEMAVVRAMAENNHNVTVVSILPLKSEWLLPSMVYIKLDRGLFDMTTAINSSRKMGFSHMGNALKFYNVITTTLGDALDDPKMYELRNNPGNRFDLMLYGYMFGDFFFGLGEHFQCPVAVLWPNVPLAVVQKLIGNPLEVAYTSSTMWNMSHDTKGLLFRLKNILAVCVDSLVTVICDKLSKPLYE